MASKTSIIVSDGEDLVIERLDRKFNGKRTAIMTVHGSDGSLVIPGLASTFAGATGTAQLAAGAVTKAKAAVFASTNTTATGSSQSIAHGLGSTPSMVLVIPTSGDNGSGATGNLMPAITEGSHTSSNVVVTVTAGATFKVFAWK